MTARRWDFSATSVANVSHHLKQLRAEGIEKVWARHARMAAACRAGVQALGLELFAAQPIDGLTVVKVPDGIDGVAIVSKLEKQYGVKIAGGQDPLKGKIFRIAHMGYIDQFDVRLDYRTEKSTLFGRMSHEDPITITPGYLPPPAVGGGPSRPGTRRRTHGICGGSPPPSRNC